MSLPRPAPRKDVKTSNLPVAVRRSWRSTAHGKSRRGQTCSMPAIILGGNANAPDTGSTQSAPFLDCWFLHVYDACKPFLTGDFWLGTLNHFNSRVDLTDLTEDEIHDYIKPLQRLIEPAAIKLIYKTLKGMEFIRFKSSIVKICEAK